ncbi:hypothetical protein ACFL54_06735 [Planctomycetota bacterium]
MRIFLLSLFFGILMVQTACFKPGHRRYDLKGFHRYPVSTIAVAPVRNNSGGLLFVPQKSGLEQPGDEWPYGGARERRSVTYLFREMSLAYLAQKNYTIVNAEDFENSLAELASQGLTEGDMLAAINADAILFITINYWDISNINKNCIITLAADVEVQRRKDGRIIWVRQSGRSSVQISDPLKSDKHEFYIEKFLHEIFSTFPLRQ